MRIRSLLVGAIALSIFTCVYALWTRGNPLILEERSALIAHREKVEKELEDIAIIDRKLMVQCEMGRACKRTSTPKTKPRRCPSFLAVRLITSTSEIYAREHGEI
jgi:hypothetical protein